MVLFQISPTALCSLDTAIIPWLLLPADGNTHLRGIPGKLNASEPPCSSITSLFVLYSIDLPGSLQIAALSKRTADVSGRWAVGFQSHCGLRVSRIILEQVNEVGQIPTLQQQRLSAIISPGTGSLCRLFPCLFHSGNPDTSRSQSPVTASLFLLSIPLLHLQLHSPSHQDARSNTCPWLPPCTPSRESSSLCK